MKEKKKALAVVAGPYRFCQVLWLYTQFKEYEWSILLLPYGKSDRIIHELHQKCDKLGIFKDIYHSKMVGQNSSVSEQLAMFFKMFFYYLVGKKKILMKKNILLQTEEKDFDVFFVGCEYSIVEGSIIGLAEEKEVYIFEEGMSDYMPRKKFPAFHYKEILSYLFTKMGYFSPYQTFEMENIKLCIKYSSIPESLYNRGYEKVFQLFGKNQEEYHLLLNSIYCFDENLLKDFDVLLFTTVIDENIEDNKNYMENIHRWLVEKYSNKKILIKKHPRDCANYDWQDLKCTFIDEHIPAEILTQFVTNQEVVMMKTSTVLISLLKRTSNIYILFSKNGKYNKKNREETIKILKIDEERMIYL